MLVIKVIFTTLPITEVYVVLLFYVSSQAVSGGPKKVKIYNTKRVIPQNTSGLMIFFSS